MESDHIKKKRFLMGLKICTVFFVIYSVMMVQHLVDDHHAGHHLVYFCMIPIVTVLCVMALQMPSKS